MISLTRLQNFSPNSSLCPRPCLPTGWKTGHGVSGPRTPPFYPPFPGRNPQVPFWRLFGSSEFTFSLLRELHFYCYSPKVIVSRRLSGIICLLSFSEALQEARLTTPPSLPNPAGWVRGGKPARLGQTFQDRAFPLRVARGGHNLVAARSR